MSALSAILREQITRQGPMSCERFMREALYCPELGYYEREQSTPGRAGDFATSVSTGPVFGRLLAFQFLNWLGTDTGPDCRTPMLVECGAHDGRLAEDILAALTEPAPGAGRRFEYWILEPSPRRRRWQEQRLAPFAGRVHWAASFVELPRPVTGVIFSNELLDAMPVRRLGWDARARRWFEWGVGLCGDAFEWRRLAETTAGSEAVYDALGLAMTPAEREALEAQLPDGFTVELNGEAVRWWTEAARALGCGALVAFDYGGTVETLFRPERAGGTLRAYHRHRVSDRVLENPGGQDLTAHVNFTAIRRAGEAAGLHTAFLGSQERFLSAVLKETTVSGGAAWNWTGAAGRQLRTLLHAEHLGRAMGVLAQKRDVG
jgi:SAM-dependent MidA family methyltransferase